LRKRILNQADKANVFYGLHFCPGVAQYDEPGKESFKVFLNQNTIKEMNETFAGRPVYVDHVDEVDLTDKNEIDGWVTESFYNAVDGMTWCKFIAVSDRALERIKQGWKLSNAYIPKGYGAGGMWNGVPYEKEITSGEFEHLAIVQNPRYAESVILTPEAFKKYCDDKRSELAKIANSKKQGVQGMLKLWNRKPVENSADLENMSVTLPKSGKEMTLTTLVNEMDKIENMHGYANGDHLVKVGDEEMSVNDMIAGYGKMKHAMDKEAEEKKNKKKNAEELDLAEKKKNAEMEEKKKNMTAEELEVHNAEEEKKKKENEAKEAAAKEEAKGKAPGAKDERATNMEDGPETMHHETKKHENSFDKIRNAERDALMRRDPVRVNVDELSLGQERYGS
jgi:hypothetical protein